MRAFPLRAGALLAATAGRESFARAAVVEAGSLTSVAVEAPLYDSAINAADGGCSPVGCVGDNTRDGDATAPESRWSCKPDLGADGSTCSVTYTLGEPLTLNGLNIAMYLGDTRTRSLDIYVDAVLQTSWTSSGMTTDFENVELAVDGQAVELRGVLADSEWLSIMEVEILVDDGVASDQEVEAEELGAVTATAALFDSRLGSANGCDPDGCTAALTRDGDMSEGSRWSCAPSLGGTCSISYDLGAVRTLSQLRLALHKGDTRTRSMDVSVDGILATTWSSSGTTADFESIDLSGYSGQDITITGILADSEWLSIVETEIMVLSGGVVPPPSPAPITPSPVFAPVATPTPVVPTPEQLYAAQEIGAVGTVTTSATFFDPSLSEDDGCDPSGCTAALTRDGDYAGSSRWSCAPKLGGDGDTCTISYDLGQVYSLARVMLAMYKGTERQTTVEVRVDGTLITTWTSSGTTDGLQSIIFTGVSGQVVELTGVLADSEWLSIVETQIMVWPDNVVTTPPSPTPSTAVTPAPAGEPPVTSPPTGELATVGLIPLADCTGCFAEELPPFYSKDGDFSTSWTCVDGNLGCTLRFDLFYYRHIKQVKIALPDGAERAVDMKISDRYIGTLTEAFVTSSGTTDGFETYDFDVFTNEILIEAQFSDGAQTISISEVEFVEELQAGEISISDWDTPYDVRVETQEEPTTDGFEWSSDSDEAIDQTLKFELAFYAMVDAVEIKFPAGDTYKFDIVVNDDKIRGETLKTIEGFESADTAEWQSFDLSQYLDADEYLTEINIVVKGTGSGAPGFKMLDLRVLGTVIDNPTGTLFVGSTLIERWTSLTDRYPDFVAEGTGDQKVIMEAICAVKKASFDGVDCVGGDDAATGSVSLPLGNWYVDGNIFMKSGVFLDGSFSDEDPYFTGIILEEGAAGKTDIDAMVVMDGISDAKTSNIWIRGHYDPDTSNDSPAVDGLGSTCLSVVGSTNITLSDAEIRYCDGDAMVVRNSNMINIDAGEYEELYAPWSIASSRGTGLTVDSCDSVWIRRHTLYENGVAGIHITGSNNVTFDAAMGPESTLGQGNVGSTSGQQPIEIIVESSTLVTFNDLRVSSSNDPVMTVSDSSAVSFNNIGLASVATDTCVIQTDDPTTVAVDDDEVTLDGTCYVKV
ncbi:unnamed protein product [Scytosiphon promiscuus]